MRYAVVVSSAMALVTTAAYADVPVIDKTNYKIAKQTADTTD